MSSQSRGYELELAPLRKQLEKETSERTQAALAVALSRKRLQASIASKHEQVRVFPYDLRDRIDEERHNRRRSCPETLRLVGDKSLDPFRPPRRQHERARSFREANPEKLPSVPESKQTDHWPDQKTAGAIPTSIGTGPLETVVFPVTSSSLLPVAAASQNSSKRRKTVTHRTWRVPPVSRHWRVSSRLAPNTSASDALAAAPGCRLGSTFAAPAFASFSAVLAQTNAEIAQQRALRGSTKQTPTNHAPGTTVDWPPEQKEPRYEGHELQRQRKRDAIPNLSLESSKASRPAISGQPEYHAALSSAKRNEPGLYETPRSLTEMNEETQIKRRRRSRWDHS
ncbi:hypothetical protein CCYA_CCYA16G4104 [Cyanidiococcus yangmingshanensis]|nr:hypothetical protein CCYA_CCYA16G4104 [Cyanidiococcus yangmingshanensis]